MFTSCPQLTLLDLTLTRCLTVDVVQQMVQCLPRLRTLRLNCCYGQGISWLSILRQLECLQELAFINDTPEYFYDDPPANPDGQTLLPVPYTLDDLEQDQNGSDLNDDTVDGTSENDSGGSEGDAELEFEFMLTQDTSDIDEDEKNLRPDYLGTFLVARAPTLLKLSFEGSDLVGFKLFEAFDHLPNDSADTEATLSALDRERPPLLALKYLNLAKTSVLQTRYVIEPLLRQCPNLEVLDISGNFEAPWDRLQWSILPQYCLNLRSLNLSQLSSIDNDQLIQVVQACLGFCSLIASQSNIQSKTLNAIVDRHIGGQQQQQQRAASFVELDVSWCPDVSQEAIERVLLHVPTLKSIKISWCQQVELSVFQARWSCLGLQELEVEGLDKPRSDDGEVTPCGRLVEWTMFERVSQLRLLERLVIGSNEVVISIAEGFGQLELEDDVEGDRVKRLQYLRHLGLVGNVDHPLARPEMEVLARAFPRLRHLHFGIGLLSQEMQSWLVDKRPDILQEEQRIYY
ncbi:hypothetical protein BGZ54_005579 [Gamsiella multidivaricata]|nr:hypothetical protein BGZ54_005579 [Gamsiella multidivaricata]